MFGTPTEPVKALAFSSRLTNVKKTCSPLAVGRVFSPALKLRNKKRGASQTHNAKNVAISENPGTSEFGPRYIRPLEFRDCEVSLEK